MSYLGWLHAICALHHPSAKALPLENAMQFAALIEALKFAGRVIPAARELAKAMRKDSPGGKRITPKERKRIAAKLMPALEAALEDLDLD